MEIKLIITNTKVIIVITKNIFPGNLNGTEQKIDYISSKMNKKNYKLKKF